MRTTVFCLALLILHLWASAEATIKLKIEGVEKNGGKVYVSVFNEETGYKAREPFLSFILNADNETIHRSMNLPAGHYVFSIYQDSNDNGKLDTNMVGIPREKFGFSNYDGKNAPGSFNRHKVEIQDEKNEVVVKLHKI
ncbi:MAG: DUF2141 domain-containing protein [Bacteroidales bacterium]